MKTTDFLKKMRAKCDDEIEKLKARLDELEKINDESEDETELKEAGEELDGLKAKKAELEAELAEIDAQIKALEGEEPAPEDMQPRKKAFIKMEERKMNENEKIERAEAFKNSGKMKIESRAVLVSGGTVATPTGVDGINDRWGDVSSIVDLVKVVDCSGMSGNKVAYEIAGSEAGAKAEGSAAATSEPTFGFVTIQPSTVGLISYVSDQVRKQTPLDYETKVKDSAMNALKAKMAKVITEKIQGSALLDKVTATVTSGKGVIDEKTLRKLVLAYGGAEGVEGNAWLFLSKADLIAFGDVRGTNDKKAVYEIEPNPTNPNVGIIKDGGLAVNYCINSAVATLNGTAQPASSGADKVTILYGQPTNFELDLFGDYEVKVSEDYKFAENLLAIRGQVDAGGDIVKDKGFVALVLPKAA